MTTLIRAPGLQRRVCDAAGFTLIEVLIVMVILGVVASGLSLSFQAVRAQDTHRELDRLRLVLEASAERARVQGQALAFELISDGYRFSRLDTDDRWLPFEDPPVFTARVLPEGMRWGSLRNDSGTTQRLVFAQRSPRFELEILVGQQRARLRGSVTGAITLERDTDDNR